MNRKMRIFISHLHGDHVFGLPGMLHSLAFMGRTRTLEIFGPKGIHQLVSSINAIVKFNSTQFPLVIKEVHAGKIVDDDGYVVRAASAFTRQMDCVGRLMHDGPAEPSGVNIFGPSSPTVQFCSI